MAKCEVPDQTPPWKGGGLSETARFATSLSTFDLKELNA